MLFSLRSSKYFLSCLSLIALWVISSVAHSHSLKVFAYFEGDAVKGKVYFAGGAPAKQVKVTIEDRDETLLETLSTTDTGEFISTKAMPLYVRVIADSLDGHQGIWALERELETSKNTDSLVISAEDRIRSDAESSSHLKMDAEHITGMLMPAISNVVASAVNKEVAPLRVELNQYKNEARLSDVIGGIGFIFGLAGCFLWWRSRS